MKIIKIIITSILANFILLISIVSLYMAMDSTNTLIERKENVIAFVLSFVIYGLSILTIFRIRKNEKRAFLLLMYCALMYPLLWGFFVLRMEANEFVDVLISSIFCILLVIPVFVILEFDRIKESIVKAQPVQIEEVFEVDKVEWHFPMAEKEYREKFKIQKLADTDIEKIWEYSTNSIAYLFAWLVKRNYINHNTIYNGFVENRSFMEEFDGIKEEKNTPIYLILGYLDGTFFASEFIKNEDILDFLYVYFEKGKLVQTLSYEEDFRKVIGGYCKEFDWNLYHTFESYLDDRFYLYVSKIEDMTECQHGMLECKTMHSILEVLSSHFVSFEYIKLCKEFFEKEEENLKQALEQKLLEEGIESECMNITKMLIGYSRILSKPSFILEVEWGLQAEHGLLVGFREDKALSIGDRQDADPWYWYREEEE